MLIEHFCTVCGNELVLADGQVCNLCRPFIEGPLRMAWDAIELIRTEWGICHIGLSSDISFGRTLAERVRKFSAATHLYVHPKSHGESSYVIEESLEQEPVMHVECGVKLYASNASCYWVFDNDNIDTHDVDYTGSFSYHFIDGKPVYLSALASSLDLAADVAYMSDYRQCAVCDGHFYIENGPCCEGGDPDQDEQELDDDGPDNDERDEGGMTQHDYYMSDMAYDAARERGRL